MQLTVCILYKEVSVRIGGFRSDQVLTILVSIDFDFVRIDIASKLAVVGM